MTGFASREPAAGDDRAWTALRAKLWPAEDPAELAADLDAMRADPDQVALLLFDAGGAAVGLLEGAIHRDPPAAPYAHVEAWYVEPHLRGRGLGRRLVEQFQDWCVHRAIRILTSDTSPTRYPLSTAAHAAAGFRTLADVRVFVKVP